MANSMTMNSCPFKTLSFHACHLSLDFARPRCCASSCTLNPFIPRNTNYAIRGLAIAQASWAWESTRCPLSVCPFHVPFPCASTYPRIRAR